MEQSATEHGHAKKGHSVPASLRHMPDIGNHDRFGVLFIALEAHRVTAGGTRLNNILVVRSHDEGVAVAVGEVETLGSSSVYIAGREQR